MTGALFRGLLLLALGASGQALAERSDWALADEAKMRVLLTASRGDVIDGGVEILLEPGWYTYWRNPGEAGLPPIFDFSGSTNVAEVDVRYPAPERYHDGVSVSLIYRDEVVFPLTITPERPEEPVTVDVDLTFGVCKDVCIPARARAAVTLANEAPRDALAEARLKSFARRLPSAPEPGRFAVESVVAEDDALLIDIRMPDSVYSDLFADPPKDWFIGQPVLVSRVDGVSRYRLSLAGKPKGVDVRGQTFQFVAVAGGEAIEEEIEIR